MKPNLGIMEQIAPAPSAELKFRIVEFVFTIDGMRTRLTNKSFATVEEAREYIRVESR